MGSYAEMERRAFGPKGPKKPENTPTELPSYKPPSWPSKVLEAAGDFFLNTWPGAIIATIVTVPIAFALAVAAALVAVVIFSFGLALLFDLADLP